MRDTLYKEPRVPVMSLIKINDLEGTLNAYCRFLEETEVAAKVTAAMEEYRRLRFNLRDCVLGTAAGG